MELPRFDLVKRNDEYVIFREDQPMQTPAGNEISSPNGRLLKHILTDLLVSEAGKNILPVRLYTWQRDFLTEGDDHVQRNFPGLLDADPFVRLKTGKQISTSNSESWEMDPVNISFWILSGLLAVINDFFEEKLKQADLSDEDENPFPGLIRLVYSQLSIEEKAAVNLLVSEHEPGIVLPLLLVQFRISPAEYTKGMIALTGGHPEKRDYESLLGETASIHSYLMACRPVSDSGIRIEEFIRNGESDSLEFKSTLRWDLRQGKTTQQIERAALKTISAFLNSSGGNLLIGVRDDGSIEGIESDRLQNDDRWLLHLWTLIRTCFGKEVSPFIQTSLEKVEGKTVCMVRCKPSVRPVFLRQPGFEEEFYVRVGPGSAAMAVSEALKYIEDRFPSR